MLRFILFFILTSFFTLSSIIVVAQSNEKFYVGYKEKGKSSYYGEKMHGKATASGEIYDMFAMTAAHRELPFNSIIKVVNLNEPDKWVTLRINDRGPFSKNRILDISKRAALKLNMEKAGVLEVEMEVLKVGDNKTLNAQKDSLNANSDTEKKDIIVEKDSKKDKKSKKEDIAKKEAKPKEQSKSTIANLPVNQRFKSVGTYNSWGTPVSKEGYGIQIASYEDIEQAIKVTNEAKSLGLNDVNIESGWSDSKHSYRIIWGAWSTQDNANENLSIAIKKGFSSAFVKAHFKSQSAKQKTGKD